MKNCGSAWKNVTLQPPDCPLRPPVRGCIAQIYKPPSSGWMRADAAVADVCAPCLSLCLSVCVSVRDCMCVCVTFKIISSVRIFFFLLLSVT